MGWVFSFPYLSDSTMALLREGYQFIPNRCKSLKSEVFQAKILSKEVMCLSGNNAAKLFYNNDLFERKNAAPERLQKSLTGTGGVQSLDDAAHRNRKAMFLSLMSPGKLGKFVKILNDEQNKAGFWWLVLVMMSRLRILVFLYQEYLPCPKAVLSWRMLSCAKTELTVELVVPSDHPTYKRGMRAGNLKDRKRHLSFSTPNFSQGMGRSSIGPMFFRIG